MELIARRVFKIGVQSLWRVPSWPNSRYIVGIYNSTYQSTVEIPADRVPLWKKALTKKP